MSSEEQRTKAVDLSHHFCDYARRYGFSPLKDLQKYFEKNKNIISFSGG